MVTSVSRNYSANKLQSSTITTRVRFGKITCFVQALFTDKEKKLNYLGSRQPWWTRDEQESTKNDASSALGLGANLH